MEKKSKALALISVGFRTWNRKEKKEEKKGKKFHFSAVLSGFVKAS